jgi:hypothetical protein
VVNFYKGDLVIKYSPVILAVFCFGTLKCDEIKPLSEHRVSFSLLQLGYDYLKPNTIYTGADAKINAIWNPSHNRKSNNDHFVNGEVRMGYNALFGTKDTFIPYGAIGFSVFHIHKNQEYLRDWSYLALGVKYFHQFSDTFEMGLHVKGYRSLQEKHFMDNVSYLRNNMNWSYEIGVPLVWHFGETRSWEVQFEPYYLQIPTIQKTEYIGSRLSFGYRF